VLDSPVPIMVSVMFKLQRLRTLSGRDPAVALPVG
jgi:hypothetical protein